MKLETSKILQRKKKSILEQWMKNQLTDDTLREDLISNEELREQSDELLNILLSILNEGNIGNGDSSDFEPVIEIISGISITRARQGFSPRETGLYILSLKESKKIPNRYTMPAYRLINWSTALAWLRSIRI